jgi:hypothetical protein
MAEDQLGPKSPIVPLDKDQGALSQPQNADKTISMRIRPGTKSSSMLDPPPPVDSSDVSTQVNLFTASRLLRISLD